MSEKKKVRRLTGLQLQEVSLCAQGMNREAKVNLFKSADTTLEKDARTFREILADRIEEKNLADRFTAIWDLTYALRESIESIVKDEDAASQQLLLDQTVSEFWAAMTETLPGLTLPLTKQGETMTIEELKKSLETVQQERDAALAENALLKGMTAREKSYYDTLSDDMKKKFMGMKQEERTAAMDKAGFQKAEPTEEELLKAMPASVRKMVEDAQAAAAEAQRIAKAEQDKRETAELIAKAERDFGQVPGKPEEKAAILKHLAGAPEDVRKGVENLLKQYQALVVNGFVAKGHSQDVDPASPGERLNKMAQDLAVKKGISHATAYDEVIGTEEGRALYKEMRAGGRK